MKEAKHPMELPAPIKLLRRGVNVLPILDELADNSHLWNENTFRTAGGYAGNPHAKIDDIIVRFNHWKNWKGDRQKFNERHESVWWKAYEALPSLKALVFDLARLVFAESIGMVLITRIPPGVNVDRHTDAGWHAQQYVKYALQLKAAPGQRFCFDETSLETLPGDLYTFDNSRPHWVLNPTTEERITLIICLRTKQPTCMKCEWKGET